MLKPAVEYEVENRVNRQCMVAKQYENKSSTLDVDCSEKKNENTKKKSAQNHDTLQA